MKQYVTLIYMQEQTHDSITLDIPHVILFICIGLGVMVFMVISLLSVNRLIATTRGWNVNPSQEKVDRISIPELSNQD